MRQRPQFDEKVLPEIIKDFSAIVGQYPSPRAARKSIATFKVREGETVGIVATLRGKRMQDFLKKVISIALPRVRDFRGIDLKQFDERGNLTIGFKDQTVFPEIVPEATSVSFGFEVTFVGNTKTKEEGVAFYRALGLPLKKEA